MAEKQGEDTVSFGFREVARERKRGLVRDVFDSVAKRYDLMNDLMSLGVHRLWKDSFVAQLNPRADWAILDVAGGTGDIALRIHNHVEKKNAGRQADLTVLDINAA